MARLAKRNYQCDAQSETVKVQSITVHVPEEMLSTDCDILKVTLYVPSYRGRTITFQQVKNAYPQDTAQEAW